MWGRDTTGRQYAPTATTRIHLMRVRRMAITDLAGLSAECSSAPGRGMATAAAGADATTAVAITAVEVITAAVAIMAAAGMAQATAVQAMVRAMAAEVMVVVAPMDAHPTVDAVMPGAAIAPAAVAVDMAAAIANALASLPTAKAHDSGRGLYRVSFIRISFSSHRTTR